MAQPALQTINERVTCMLAGDPFVYRLQDPLRSILKRGRIGSKVGSM